MAEKTIKEQVHLAFSELDDRQFQFAQSYVAGLSERLASAEKASVQWFLSFFLVWAAIYLVAKGLVNEADVSGIKLTSLRPLLVAGPVALGYLSYVFSAALATTMVLQETLQECYRRFIPKLSETYLDTLMCSHTFIGAEEQNVVTRRSWLETGLANLIQYGIVFFAWLASVAVILWAARLLSHLAYWPKPVIIASGFFGVLFWLRGASLIFHRV